MRVSECLEEIRTLAPAKLNLFLEVVNRRADGYHDLVTIMHAIDLTDAITVRLWSGRPPGKPAVELECRPPVTALPERNLAHRAAALLLPAEPTCRVEIELKKRIPPGAGLGGGSSDAAAVLTVLNDALARHGLATRRDHSELVAAAVALGADVPFFLTGGTARCEGVGERVTPLAGVPVLHFVLVVPAVQVSTASIFGDARLNLTAPRRDVTVCARCLSEGDVDRLAGPGSRDGLFNRLARVALELRPDLEAIERAVRENGGRSFQVTGSGAGLFALCPGGRAEAEQLAARLPDDPAVARTYVVQSFRTDSPE